MIVPEGWLKSGGMMKTMNSLPPRVRKGWRDPCYDHESKQVHVFYEQCLCLCPIADMCHRVMLLYERCREGR